MDNKALYTLGYGLYVLTAREDGRDNGCIINTMLQVTSNPLVAVIAVNKLNHTHDMILRTGQCNVSVLTVEAPFAVYKHFGFQSGKTVDKFADCERRVRAQNGVVYLPKYTNAYFSLQVKEAKDMGTHTLFFADITDAVRLGEAESVTYAYYQANVKPKPQPATTGKTVWRCKICGYEYVGETLPADFICPLCKHGAADFEKITV